MSTTPDFVGPHAKEKRKTNKYMPIEAAIGPVVRPRRDDADPRSDYLEVRPPRSPKHKTKASPKVAAQWLANRAARREEERAAHQRWLGGQRKETTGTRSSQSEPVPRADGFPNAKAARAAKRAATTALAAAPGTKDASAHEANQNARRAIIADRPAANMSNPKLNVGRDEHTTTRVQRGVAHPDPLLAAAAAAHEKRLDGEGRKAMATAPIVAQPPSPRAGRRRRAWAAMAKAALVAQPLTHACTQDGGSAGQQVREYELAALIWRKSLRPAREPGSLLRQENVEAGLTAGQDRDVGPIILKLQRLPPAPGVPTPNHSPAPNPDEIVARTKAALAAIDGAEPTPPMPAKDWSQLAPFMEHVFDLPQTDRDVFLELFTSHPDTLFVGIEKLENGDIEFAYAGFDHVFFGALFNLLSDRAKKRAAGSKGQKPREVPPKIGQDPDA